jgi:hypothetical protein
VHTTLHRLLLHLILPGLLLSACVPAAAVQGEDLARPRAWFDSPLPGTGLTGSGICEIVAHAASPLGVSAVELWMNDTQENSMHAARENGTMITYTRDCGDLPPGEYALRLRARDADGNWSPYAETSMSILEGARATPVPPLEALSTPTPAPFSAGGGSVSIESVSSGTVYSGDATCGPLDVTITARAAAPGSIAVVVLFYRAEPGGAGGYSNVVMAPIGGDQYRATISTESILDGAAEASLQYQVVVQLADGDTSLRTPLMSDIAIQPCGTITTITTITAADCTQYQTKRACESRDCKWMLLPAIIPVYACGNP